MSSHIEGILQKGPLHMAGKALFAGCPRYVLKVTTPWRYRKRQIDP